MVNFVVAKVTAKYLYFGNDRMTRVLIVGGGITGAVTASLLKCRLPQNSHVAVWELCKQAGYVFSVVSCERPA